jgi:nucleotide-binding universal stress UspA family protein
MKRITWFTNSRAMVESLVRIQGLEKPRTGKSDDGRFSSTSDYRDRIRTNPVLSYPDNRPEADDLTIVVSIDFSLRWKDAAEAALSIAHYTHAKLILCHAIFPVINSFAPDYPPWLADDSRKEAFSKLESTINSAKEAGVNTTCVIEEGTPAGVTLKVARRHAASLIVLTEREHGMWARLLFGRTTTEQVAREADCHVMVIRPDSKFKKTRSCS